MTERECIYVHVQCKFFSSYYSIWLVLLAGCVLQIYIRSIAFEPTINIYIILHFCVL